MTTDLMKESISIKKKLVELENRIKEAKKAQQAHVDSQRQVQINIFSDVN